MKTRFGFNKTQRITKDREFSAVFKNGKRYSSNGLTMVVYKPLGRAGELPRLGLVVSHKIGSAVKRNKLKRRLREVFRLLTPELNTGYDVIIIPKKDSVGLSYIELRKTFINISQFLGLLDSGMIINK